MIAIATCIKNEHAYIREWIDYHISRGVEHFYLFEDYGSDSHKDVLADYDCVTLRTFADINVKDDSEEQNRLNPRQLKVYRWCVRHLECDWLALIDVDEFITFADGEDFDSITNGKEEQEGIYLFWKTIGADGQVHKTDAPVTERFHQEVDVLEYDQGWHFKTLVNMSLQPKLVSIHHVENGVNTLGIMTHDIICYHRAWIRHYMTKSWDEWVEKLTSRGDILTDHRKLEDFFIVNKDMEYLKEDLIPDS